MTSAPEMSPPASDRTSPEEPPRRIWAEVVIFWAVTAVSIRLAVSSGLSEDVVSVVKSLALVYLPLGWMLAMRRDLDRYGLTLQGWRQALGIFAVVSLVTLLPFWIANHVWETTFLGHRFEPLAGATRSEAAELSTAMGWATLLAAEILAVGLPEEVFYRGYLQTRVGQVVPARWTLLGARIGWSLPIASLFFVAGHLAVRPAAWQLAIFFPALVFGWMRERSGSLIAPILYHALCNVGMFVLQRCYV